MVMENAALIKTALRVGRLSAVSLVSAEPRLGDDICQNTEKH